MKQRVRILAATAIVGVQCTTGLGSLAMAQSQTVTVTGQRPTNGGYDCWPNCTAYSGGSSSGGSSGGSFPENEAYSAPPPPPPPPPKKTAEQRAAEKQKCENQRIDDRQDTTTMYNAQMQVCASTNSTSYGYFIEQWRKFTGQALNIGPGTCSDNLTQAFNTVMREYDKRRDVCLANADKG